MYSSKECESDWLAGKHGIKKYSFCADCMPDVVVWFNQLLVENLGKYRVMGTSLYCEQYGVEVTFFSTSTLEELREAGPYPLNLEEVRLK